MSKCVVEAFRCEPFMLTAFVVVTTDRSQQANVQAACTSRGLHGQQHVSVSGDLELKCLSVFISYM